jgi:hypothetical protein
VEKVFHLLLGQQTDQHRRNGPDSQAQYVLQGIAVKPKQAKDFPTVNHQDRTQRPHVQDDIEENISFTCGKEVLEQNQVPAAADG